MSTTADLRHDHRHLMSIAVNLSMSPTMTAMDMDRLRYRIDSLRCQLSDHLLREANCFACIASSVAGKARQAEVEVVEDMVNAFSAKWRTAGEIESDPGGYIRTVADLRLRLDRLIRREEDCMFALLDGGHAEHTTQRAAERSCPTVGPEATSADAPTSTASDR